MFESLLITFRETLEAALVVFIVLSYLKKINKNKYNYVVYLGVGSALAVSLIGAWLFAKFAGGLVGTPEQIFEGTVMIIAAILLTTMIVWMARAKHVRHQIEASIDVELSDRHLAGLFAIAFTAVLREGVETVLFLGAIQFRGAHHELLGSLLGIAIGIVFGYGVFYGARRLQLKTFFRITSLLLIFFAAGLVGGGLHEFQEAGWISFLTKEAWNISPAQLADGSFPLLHEEGAIGSVLKGVFGYSGNPTILQALAYLAYSAIAFFTYSKIGLKARSE